MWHIEVVFWLAAAMSLYTLVGYPLLTLILAAIVRKRVDKQPIQPKVSFIIAAYNEEDAIAQKIEQTLALDYPSEKLEIIVASDGSTDRTDEIVGSFSGLGVKLYRSESRSGKTGALNETVETATGDILVFSDATGTYSPQSVRELVANFNDPSVGCVTGRVTYKYGEDVNSQGFRGYQRIAVAIRRAESLFGSQTSVSGSIHAMRRELFQPSPPEFSLDVIDAVHAVSQGYRVVYENDALSQEESRDSVAAEFRCRVRIGVRGTSMIPYVLRQLVGHGRLGYAFQMISHKIFRWELWFFLLVALVSNVILIERSTAYASLALLQLAFYGVACLGLVSRHVVARLPLVSTASLFVMGNAAMAVGAIKCLAGRRMAKWEPVR